MPRLTFVSLFAGIGGMDLGLERAGLECIGQVEIDDYATRVLARHWPHIPRWRNVRDVGAHNLPCPDLLCGGFPCQDISNAGKRAGLAGERSGLWREFARLIGELRPRYVLVENVAALLGRGLGDVLGDLAALGFDAEWHCIPAAAVGAPHIRDRLFLVAYTDGTRRAQHQPISGWLGEAQGVSPGNRTQPYRAGGATRAGSTPRGGDADGSTSLADTAPQRRGTGRARRFNPGSAGQPEQPLQVVAHGDGAGLAQWQGIFDNAREELAAFERSCRTGTGQWGAEPDVGRVADGVPARVDRLRGLGNAVVPQAAEFIGRALIAYHTEAA
jgi:DNA (cytosine-5)-methyltransferase 1